MTGPYTVTDLEIAEALRPWFEDDAIGAAREVRHLIAPLVQEAKAHAWREGWDARAKYLGTDGNHWQGRNPYASNDHIAESDRTLAARQAAAQVDLFRAQILDPEREEAFTPLEALLSSFEAAVRTQGNHEERDA